MKRKRASHLQATCMVVGCTSLPLERHETSEGVVWLCGLHGMQARRNIADDQVQWEIAQALVQRVRPRSAPAIPLLG